MRRAFSTLGCSELSLRDVGALAERHGIAGVEYRGLGGVLDLPRYFEQTFGTPAAFAAAHAAESVVPVALNTSFALVGSGQAERAELLGYVPWAEALGVSWLRVFDGPDHGGRDYGAELAATLAWWETQRRENGWRVRLMVETHDALVTTAALAQALQAAPQLALLWDAHNTWRKGGEPPVAVWPRIRRHVVHVHVKDSVDRPSARHPFTYTLPGQGQFAMAELRAALAGDGYDGFVSLEWERRWHPYLPPLDEALTVAAQGWW